MLSKQKPKPSESKTRATVGPHARASSSLNAISWLESLSSEARTRVLTITDPRSISDLIKMVRELQHRQELSKVPVAFLFDLDEKSQRDTIDFTVTGAPTLASYSLASPSPTIILANKVLERGLVFVHKISSETITLHSSLLNPLSLFLFFMKKVTLGRFLESPCHVHCTTPPHGGKTSSSSGGGRFSAGVRHDWSVWVVQSTQISHQHYST